MRSLGLSCIILLASFSTDWALARPSLSQQSGLLKRDLNFTNPVLWEDYPDLDVFRIGDVFYYSSSSFAFSPGAPVLKSYDLVNWSPVTHSVQTLNFGEKYNLPNATDRAYVEGVWASSLRHRPSNDRFYWIGCVDFNTTYIWTSPGNEAVQNDGEVANWNWTPNGTIGTCYYDCGLLVDDDDTMYVSYGNTNISVATLSKDGLSQVNTTKVYSPPDDTYIEGSRMYKINGTYYILVTKPASAEWVLKSSSPYGPYEQRVLVDSIAGPLPNAGFSHQGGIVDTKDGQWYYVAFMDSYPGGRIPVAAPLTWTDDGWPQLVTDNGAWGKSYPMPVQTNRIVPAPVGTDNFTGSSLRNEWEWNHNPDDTKWELTDNSSGGLILKTATVTDDLFTARNTLTHRIIGPMSQGTFHVNISHMQDGDRTGAALFRDVAAYIGVWKDGASAQLIMLQNLTLEDTHWTTTSTGKVGGTGPTLDVDTQDVWLRVQADITPAFSNTTAVRMTTFWYSMDGVAYTQLGPAFPMTNSYTFFTGYRYAVFNHATKTLGGQITVKSFEMELL